MRLVLFAAVLLVLGCGIGRRGACGAVPGYLDFDNLPDTNFSCEGKVIGGYYADVETGCQMFHVCTIGQKGEITDIKFLCLNGTVFDQETRVCERVDEVDCSKTEGFYGLNLELYGNTGATYGLEEPEEAGDDHEESQSRHSQTQSSSPSPATTPSPPTTLKTTSPTTATTVVTTTSPPPTSTTAAHPFTPPTTISTISSTLHPFSPKPHGVHFSSTSSPHAFLTFPSGVGDHVFETAPEGSGGHGVELDHFPPPPPPSSSSSSAWPQVNLQSGGGSGIIQQTDDASPFHALKTTPKPVSLFGTGAHSNAHTNHQFIFSTTKAPSHFFSGKSPGGFSVTSHPPVTQFPLKNPGHLIQTNIPPDFYHDQARNRQTQKPSQGYLGRQSNVQIVPNPIHFQYTGRPTHQHQVFTTPSVQSSVISSTSSVSSVKTTIKHPENSHNTQNPPANVNSFAFGINSALSPTTFVEDKSRPNGTQHLATPPTSYDEYHERDVALDPFFKDVPRISLKQGRVKRGKRQTEGDIQRTRGSRRFRNKPAPPQITQPEVEERRSAVSNRRQSQRPSSRQQLVPTAPTLNIDTSQEPNSDILTTEIPRRLSSRRKSAFNTRDPQRDATRDSAMQESQVQHASLNAHRTRQKQQTTNIQPKATVQPPPETTSELPTTTRQPLPETSFTCEGKVVGGYYADPEADCQLFHICVLGRHGKIRDDKFLCGPGTRFDQKSRTCQTKHLVNCSLATSLYHVNLPYLFPEDNEPVPDLMFESHKVSKRATKKGASHTEQDDDLPETDFSCEDKPEDGLYADVETNCKYFHLCQKNKNGHLHLVSTFACPSGTSFNQYEGNCDASKEVECEIFSQPEHLFARSNSRNKRFLSTEIQQELPINAIRHKRNTEEDQPDTNFSCEDKSQEGLYADTETDCKYFHLCQKNKKGHLYLVSTFVCPAGTSFNQHEGNCDASKEIDCTIYSQPEHSFARSKSRNKRNALERLSKREAQHKVNRYKGELLENPPETNFLCDDKPQEGLYADTETDCKYFHLCQKNKNSLYLASTFVCPSGTSFNQHEGNCDASEEIDCVIYSQPAHSFAKSKSRNSRSIIKDHLSKENAFGLPLFIRRKREADQESTESYYTDDEIQSAERNDQSEASYEDVSEDELHDSSVENTHTEESGSFHEDYKPHKHARLHNTKKNSAGQTITNNEETSYESTEISEENKDFETQSLENSQIQSEENEEHSTDSKEIHQSNSQESYETDESASREDKTHRKTTKLKETSEVESEEDIASVEDNTEEEKEDTEQNLYDESNSVRNTSNKNSESQENSEDNFDVKESQSSEEIIANQPEKTESKHNTKNNTNARDILDSKLSDRIKSEIEDEPNISIEYSHDVPQTNKKSSNRDSHSVLDESSKHKAHANKDSSIEVDKQNKESNENLSQSSQKEGSKHSFQTKESGNSFKTKVNQLLLKLNASVEDIHKIDENSTNDDYYDYYTYDEPLLELEELKEKILSVDNSPKNRQDNFSEESNSSETEKNREDILAKEMPELTTEEQNSGKTSPQSKFEDSGKDELLHKNEKSDTIGSFPDEGTSSEFENAISTTTPVPDRFETSTEDDILLTTAININNDKVTDKVTDKFEHIIDTVNPGGKEIPMTVTSEEHKEETSTEDQDAMVHYSEATSKEDDSVTNIPVNLLPLQITEKKTNYINKKASTSSLDDNSTKIPQKEVPLTDTNEDIDSTTEITTLSPDTSTETTTPVSTTPSNLLHPYKTRPVYRTWRTTAPPPPVSIRPNSSLRLPRPSTRRGNKGTPTANNKPVIHEEKEKTRSRNEHTNQVLPQEKSKEENRNKYVTRGPFNDKTGESTYKSPTDEVSLSVTTTQQQPDEVPLTMTTVPQISTEESSISITPIPKHKAYSDSNSQNSDKSISYTSLEDYRTVDYEGITPSSVLPTFSRKKFFIDREDQKITKAGTSTTTTSTTPPTPTTTVLETVTESLSITDIPIEEIYAFTSVEAQTPQTVDDVYRDTKSGAFTCTGKELHQYFPDPLDCHLFHYCSPGFHSRQLLDFRFMCEKGTAFSPVTHRCENEDETLCANLHN